MVEICKHDWKMCNYWFLIPKLQHLHVHVWKRTNWRELFVGSETTRLDMFGGARTFASLLIPLVAPDQLNTFAFQWNQQNLSVSGRSWLWILWLSLWLLFLFSFFFLLFFLFFFLLLLLLLLLLLFGDVVRFTSFTGVVWECEIHWNPI